MVGLSTPMKDDGSMSVHVMEWKSQVEKSLPQHVGGSDVFAGERR